MGFSVWGLGFGFQVFGFRVLGDEGRFTVGLFLDPVQTQRAGTRGYSAPVRRQECRSLVCHPILEYPSVLSPNPKPQTPSPICHPLGPRPVPQDIVVSADVCRQLGSVPWAAIRSIGAEDFGFRV